MKYHDLTPQTSAAVVSSYRSGTSIPEAAFAAGCTVQDARRAIAQDRRNPSPATSAAIVSHYADGWSIAAAAAAEGVQFRTARRAIVEAGAEIRKPGRHHHDRVVSVDVEEAARLYREGVSLRALAAHYECSHEIVRQRLREAGVELRSQRGWRKGRIFCMSPSDAQLTWEMYLDGYSAAKIAAETGRTETAVYAVLRHLGMPIRSQAEAVKLRNPAKLRAWLEATAAARAAMPRPDLSSVVGV